MPNTVNDRNLLAAEVVEPAVGAWHATLEWDPGTDDDVLTGAVTFDIEGITWTGTVLRSGVHGGRARARVVGGAGGLSKELDAKNYATSAGVQVSAVLADILRGAGETVSDTAETSTLTARLPKWQRTQGLVSHALVALLDNVGSTFRVLRDGSIWVGKTAHPEAPDFPHVLIDEDWGAGILTIAPEQPLLAPGTTFQGQALEVVVHRLSAGKLRSEGHLTSAGSALRKFLGHIRRNIDYTRLYPARVSSQNLDGTLVVVPDAGKLKGQGLDKVPIRHGLPGVTVRSVPSGARVRVGFEEGNPSQPFACLWDEDTGAATVEIIFHGLLLRLGSESASQPVPLGTALLQWLNAHTHPTGVGPSGPPVVPADPSLLSTQAFV